MRRIELKLYHRDKYETLRTLVGNVEDHLDLLSHTMLCKRELKSAGIEVSVSPVFGVVQGNVVDDVLRKRYKHWSELNET